MLKGGLVAAGLTTQQGEERGCRSQRSQDKAAAKCLFFSVAILRSAVRIRSSFEIEHPENELQCVCHAYTVTEREQMLQRGEESCLLQD